MIIVNDYEVKEFYFPDGTLRITDDDCSYLRRVSREKQNGLFQPAPVIITWKFDNITEQVILYSIVHHIRDRVGADCIHLFLPYIPNARMDRTHNLPGEVNMLKYFCQFINDLHFDSVTVIDPHSDAAVNMLDHVIVTDNAPFVRSVVDECGADYLFFPDAGAAKRYSGEYNFRPYLVGKKNRDWKTGQIVGFEVDNVMGLNSEDFEGKTILIVDDICSRGGTFIGAGKALKNLGFGEINLCVTHCEDTIFDGHILDEDSPINHVYTTDSLSRQHYSDKMTVAEIEI